MILEIFKTGEHTSGNGIKKSFSESDLDLIAGSYKPETHEAPVCIGHPEDNSPAHGWIKKVFRQGEKLFAEIDNLSSNLKEGLKKKYFKKRSIALYPDLKLRHLAFVPIPAVKGLNDIPDSDLINLFDDENNLSYFESEFSYEEIESQNQLNDNNPDIKADNLSSELSNPLQIECGKEYFDNKFNKIETLFQSFSEKDTKEVIKETDDKIANLNLNLDLTYFQRNLAEKVEYGNISPAVKDKLLSIIEFLSSFNFSEGMDSFSENLFSKFDELISELPPLNILDEFAEKPDSINVQSENFDFAEVDQESRTMHTKAVNLMKTENITYLAAVTKLLYEN